MIITILILSLSMIGLCVAGYKSNITIPVSIKIVGLILILFSALEYIIKTTIYHTFLNVEWDLYLMLSGIKLNISSIDFINVIGVALYMAASVTVVSRLPGKKNKFRLILCAVPILVILFLEIPYIKESMYVSLLSSGMSLKEVNDVNDLKITLECVLIGVYILTPYYELAKGYKKTCLYQRRKDAFSVMAVWGVIDISLFVTLFGGGIYRYMFLNLGWIGFPNVAVHISNEAIMFFSSVACVIIVLFIIIRCMPIKSESTRTQILMREKDENVFSLLHTYKNAFCAIMMYADAKDGTSEVLYNNKTRLEMIKDIAEEQCDKINSVTVMFKNEVKGMIHIVNLSECVKMAIPKSKAEVKLKVNDDNVCVTAEEYKIVECLVCMLNNSYEAVKNNEGDKIIEVTVGKENSDCYIEIKDNGCGIARKDMGKIFKPFYSTKKSADNYGLGLSYVKRVVHSYGGNIIVKSKKDKFTIIQLIFKEAQKNGEN